MRKFVQQHDSKIVGTLSCLDRVIFKGHAGLGCAKAMEGFLHVRLQSWFPFQIQVHVNGHDWLARA